MTIIVGADWLVAAQRLLRAMTVQPSNAVALAANNLIGAFTVGGVWAKTTIFYAGLGTEQASLLNWKTPGTYNATNNGCSFTAFLGFTGDGSSAYLDTGMAANVLSQNSAHIHAWVTAGTDAADSTKRSVGQVAAGSFAIQPRNGADAITGMIGSTSSSSFGASGTILGHTLFNRSGATAVEAYRNGVATATPTDNEASTAPSSSNITFLRNGSTYADFRIFAGGAGGTLSSGEEAAAYAAINTYKGAVGG